MKYFLPLIYLLTVLIDAAINAFLIEKKNRKINHKIEALIYLLISVGISVPLKFYFHVHWGWLASFAITTRLAFFDGALNVFRGKKINYEGNPDKPPEQQSWYDKIELRTGISINVFRTLYLVIYILNLILFEL